MAKWPEIANTVAGGSWIGVEPINSQVQVIVDSNRLVERYRTAVDILVLPEVGFFSITRRD